MTTRQQAEQIYGHFYNVLVIDLEHHALPKIAKKVSLRCVDHIIAANPHSNPLNTEVSSTMDYWIEVRDILRDKF